MAFGADQNSETTVDTANELAGSSERSLWLSKGRRRQTESGSFSQRYCCKGTGYFSRWRAYSHQLLTSTGIVAHS